MVRLQLLGGLAIDGSGLPATARARHRHPLAVLALVAAAAPQAIGRDKIMALLWPESDVERASNSLRQALFRLRRDFGEDVFHPESASGLRLNPEGLTVDLWDFRDAIERGAIEEAVGLYGGPFLDGFSVPGGVEVSHWVEAERQRLAQQYVAALDTLARTAEEEGRCDEAVSWRHRQAAAEPFSSRVALGLLRALVAAGDRPGALAYAAVHESLVRDYLEADPDPAVTELVASLRRERSGSEASGTSLQGEGRPGESSVARPKPATESGAPAPSDASVPSTPAEIRGAAVATARPMRWGVQHLVGLRPWLLLAGASLAVVTFVVGRSMVGMWGGTAFLEAAQDNACAPNVAEAGAFTVVYTLPIPEDANYDDGLPPYSVDNSADVGRFDRVAYCLQLDDDWVWVSMAAFTEVAAQLGVPVSSTGATFQQVVSDMNVFSNVAGIVTGRGISTGNIEFWHHCFNETTSLGLPGASGTVNDFDDIFPHPRDSYDSCYGSMQVHNYGARQTVFAYNQWDRDPERNIGPDDLGIGNAPGIHPDWTFEANASRYETRILHVLAREVDGPSAAGSTAPLNPR